MKTIILAAGKASRLGKLSKNMQKCMISFGGKTAIDHLLDKLPPSEYCVCISNDFRGELVKGYINANYPNELFKFAVQKEPLGTAHAVGRCLPIEDDDLLITWSDIIPKVNIKQPTKSSIFTTNDFSCRYRFDGNSIENTDGNIIGMFYIAKEDVNTIRKMVMSSGIDFVDVLRASGINFDNIPIECFDFGTQKTLEATSDSLNTSAYATIDIRQDGVVKKTYNNRELYEKESLWYSFAPQSIRRFVPTIYNLNEDDKSITMDFIDGCNMRNAISGFTEDTMKDFLAHVIYVLDEHFHVNRYPPHEHSIIREYLEAPVQRCILVNNSVPGFDADSININGRYCKNPIKILKKNGDRFINELMPSSFSFIHGDPTLQNMMHSGGRVWLIDPKAKFGDIWLYGDAKYDYAKLFYSFFGNYDEFNAGEYELSTGGGKFVYSIKRAKFANLGDWYLQYLSRHLDIRPIDIKLIHALIWLRVVGYVLPKSIEQAMVAFLKGTELLNEVVDER